MQAWIEDPHPIVKADRDTLRRALMRGDVRKVHHYGIEHRGNTYISGRLGQADLLNQQVHVRYLEHHREFVEVFKDGEHMCTAY